MNKKFSFFNPPINNTIPENALSLEGVHDFISGKVRLIINKIDLNGGRTLLGDLQSVTAQVRAMSPEVYKDRKRGKVQYLPLVTFGGTFSQRGEGGLQETSGLIGLDIDHISHLPGAYTLEGLKERLSKDTEIGLRLLFTSPSGDGLKLVCETSGEIKDKEDYKRQFEILNTFVSRKYSLPIGSIGLDKGISDITRGCLLCYDPEAVLLGGESFRPEDHPLPKKRETPRISYSSQDWDGDGIEEIVRRVEESGIDIAPDYPEYLSLVYSFTSLGERGRSLLHRVCSLSTKYKEEDTEKDWENCIKSGESQSIGTFVNLCKRYGIDVSQHRDRSPLPPFNPPSRSVPETAPKTPTESPEDKFKEYLQIPDLRSIASTKKEGIKTPYRFRSSEGEEENFILSPGTLTLVCGKSSHGKSRLLRNLSLHIAKEEKAKGGEGVVLYFSFEESLLEVVECTANVNLDKIRLSQYETRNTAILREYFRTGELKRSTAIAREEALPLLKEFESLYTEGRLRIYYSPDLKSGELCRLLEYLSSQMKIKAVFLDYVQAIYKEGNRKDRREELREICKEINQTAISMDIPIVLSAQLNREAPNPTDMSGDNIAESADITRYANTILLLWDITKGREIKGGVGGYLSSEDGKRLSALGFDIGSPGAKGKLYAVISKNRGGTPNLEAVLEYVPETGRIQENEDLPSGENTDGEGFSGGFFQA